jgi:hypothetical protein
MAEYKKPKPGPVVKDEDAGYPQTDINKEGVMSKGRWMNNPGTKTHIPMRGKGAATKGFKFLDNC